MTAPRLPESVALRMHELHHARWSVIDIAGYLECSRSAVQSHLRREYEYSPRIEAKVAALPSQLPTPNVDVPEGYLSIREARLLIPFFPSENTAYDMARRKLFKTTIVDSRRVTTANWMREYVQRLYGDTPVGVAVMVRDIDMLLLEDLPRGVATKLAAAAALSIGTAGLSRPLSKRRSDSPAIMLWDLAEACEQYEATYHVPSTAYLNAMHAFRLGAGFVLLSPRMFRRSSLTFG